MYAGVYFMAIRKNLPPPWADRGRRVFLAEPEPLEKKRQEPEPFGKKARSRSRSQSR